MVFLIRNKNIQNLVKKYNENKLSHVFLIETNDKVQALKDIKEFVKILNCQDQAFQDDCTKCNLCHLIETETLPSLEIIFPDGQAIKKSQMDNLKQHFSSMPYLSKYNVYIINDVEKFNSSSANMMLKFIEEPEPNILGFLITNNRENVIHTIKSRCEIVKSNYDEENFCISDDLKNLAIYYLSKIEVEKEKSIVYNKIVLDAKLEREDMFPFFKIILQIYLDLFEEKRIPEELEAMQNISKKELLKRISLVSECMERLNYNINSNLLLDDFVLRLED